MASTLSVLITATVLLLISLVTLHVSLPHASKAPISTAVSPSHFTPLFSEASSPPPLPEFFQEDSLGLIVVHLLAKQNYTVWCQLLTGASTGAKLPLHATIFAPTNAALIHLRNAKVVDPNLVRYHIIPRRMTWIDLVRVRTPIRLETLLPTKSVVIERNASRNVTIDHASIVQPDLYLSPSFAIHGVSHLFNYSLFGDVEQSRSPPLPTAASISIAESTARSTSFVLALNVLFYNF